MAPTPSEEDLVSAAQAGDQEALGRLLLQHYDPLMRHLNARLPKSVQRVLDVEDVLQHTFASAFRSIDSFEYRGEGAVFAWLRSIADHRLQDALKSLRRKKRGGEQKHVERQGVEGQSSMGNLVDMLAGDTSTAGTKVARKEAIQAMQLALAELPEDYRNVMRLRYLEGRSIEETAEQINRSPAAVRSIADRAKKRLREALARWLQSVSRS